MSEERLSTVEKELVAIKAAQQPLITGMEKNTEANHKTQIAMVGLTHKIESLIDLFGNVKKTTDDHEHRIQNLELTDAAEQSGRELAMWIKRTIVVAVVGGLLTGGGWVASKVYQEKASIEMSQKK